MPDLPQSQFDRFLRPILASRFLTISALIHLLLIILLGGRVLFNKYVEPPDFQSAGDTVTTDVAPAPPPPPPDATLPTQQTMSAPPPPAPAPSSLTALTSFNTSASSFSMPLPAMQPPTISNDLSSAPQTQQFGNGSSVQLPHAMSGRGSGARQATGEKFGEIPTSEQAVLRALRWLQAQQHTDGSWGSDKFHGAFTGLALLCFLGHGETPQTSREFGVVVSKAIDVLANEASSHQGRMSFGNGFDDQNSSYQHGICTYALSEAYTMTKDPRLAPLVEQAVDYIVKGQRSDGGWAYRYDTTGGETKYGPKSDTSVSGWQIQALKAAHLTGLPGMEQRIHPVLDLAMKNLDRVFNPRDGAFGYRKDGGIDRDYTLTGVGVLSKLFWLGRPDNTVRAGVKNMESKDLSYTGADCNIYTWYYDTQACFQAQGGAWDWWNARFQKQLTDIQQSDGSWPPTGGKEMTGDYAKSTSGDGPIYRTVFCCLMLEVFYRYLPTSQDTTVGGGVEGL